MTLTAREKQIIWRAIWRIDRGRSSFCCYAIQDSTKTSIELCRKFKAFFSLLDGDMFDDGIWGLENREARVMCLMLFMEANS